MRQSFLILLILILGTCHVLRAQTGSGTIEGKISSSGKFVEFANVGLAGTSLGAASNATGYYVIKNVPAGNYRLEISSIGYQKVSQSVTVRAGQTSRVNAELEETASALGEVVVTGTMKEVSRLESPVPVEIFKPTFFRKNPTPALFEALQIVNGVRPQLNCNICNTGDIHINGLEGPYTMILIDGMPIVSGLSTVYGLNGIPNSLVERIEIVKGPASTLYGSEAVGGLVNVITKSPDKAPLVSADVFGTTYGELNADASVKVKVGKGVGLFGMNHFNYSFPTDKNGDGFTDVTLSKRTSLFNKWSFTRKNNWIGSLAGRYVYEDRWGGQMDWGREWRGTDSVYGESIYTNRFEVIGSYQLPINREKVVFSFSANAHRQNSYYGTTPFMADQRIGFGQLTWDKTIERHSLLTGLAFRYTWYDDNTPATRSADSLRDANAPSRTLLPGIFMQDEISLHEKHKVLLGLRYDYNSVHGSILTPRFNYKFMPNKNNVFRLSFGNGYRVANVFTEDHAALTGARQVLFTEELKPERSYNGNLNVQKFFYIGGSILAVDASAFYTYFTNRIIADYITDPNKIIFDNLKGHAISKGLTLNTDWTFSFPLKIIAGITLMDVYSVEKNGNGEREKLPQLLTEKFSGTFSISYTVPGVGISLDYTGTVYGPMKLPLLGPLDPRPEYSPWFSIQNIQVSKKFASHFEVYGGIKNILNFRPPANSITRPFDPFDKSVTFAPKDPNDPYALTQVVPTPDNPYALTFDPNYVYAANQGIRAFVGLRYTIY